VYKADDDLGLEFHNCESSFLRCYLPKINKLPEPIRDWITSIQPYQRPHLFHELHSLWNRDKHRTPTVICTAADTGRLGDWDDRPPFTRIEFPKVGGHKDHQLLMSVIVPRERSSEFKPEFSLLVVLDPDGAISLDIVGRPQSVVDYLRHVQKYILTNVIPKFQPYA
jgi:hypothetical protein